MTDLALPLRVSLVAVPDVTMSTLSGIHDALTCFNLLDPVDPALPLRQPFEVEVVAATTEQVPTASGMPVPVHRSIAEPGRTDIVVIPSMMVPKGVWQPGRYPRMVRWLSAMHAGGSMLCSACSGVLLLAETGLLNGREATVHWAYARTFREHFPMVALRLEQALVVAGDREELVMSGASASWHDLVLYLVSRLVGPAAAQAITRFMLLEWHTAGQAPYARFEAPTDHGDAAIASAQAWLTGHFAVSTPVTELVRRSGLAPRTFKRRFQKATGFSPLEYVQRLRLEEAKRRLERTADSVDRIGWAVGYQDPAFFRRLFKRVTRVTPGAYRRKFRMPEGIRTVGPSRSGR